MPPPPPAAQARRPGKFGCNLRRRKFPSPGGRAGAPPPPPASASASAGLRPRKGGAAESGARRPGSGLRKAGRAAAARAALASAPGARGSALGCSRRPRAPRVRPGLQPPPPGTEGLPWAAVKAAPAAAAAPRSSRAAAGREEECACSGLTLPPGRERLQSLNPFATALQPLRLPPLHPQSPDARVVPPLHCPDPQPLLGRSLNPEDERRRDAAAFPGDDVAPLGAQDIDLPHPPLAPSRPGETQVPRLRSQPGPLSPKFRRISLTPPPPSYEGMGGEDLAGARRRCTELQNAFSPLQGPGTARGLSPTYGLQSTPPTSASPPCAVTRVAPSLMAPQNPGFCRARGQTKEQTGSLPSALPWPPRCLPGQGRGPKLSSAFTPLLPTLFSLLKQEGRLA
ncbi:uncharacterized protein [Notamacropus eugenii]|uniref:uncharacterized protein n=1 Tax=Notamacropus eugenii TaxID=9315 RepID=UPI003B679C99